MLRLKTLFVVLIICCGVGICVGMKPQKESYQELDQSIVSAYNHRPRKTSKVYVISRYILAKADKDKSSTGLSWELKARKLITVSCYYECTRAIDRKLYRQAYVWAKRGTDRGTEFGKIGQTPLKNLYKYLSFAANELAKTPMVRNSDPKKISAMIDNYQDLLSIRWKNPALLLFAQLIIDGKLAKRPLGII